MKRSTIILLVFFLFLSPLTLFIHPTPARAFGFSYTRYWFFIEDTGIIDYPEMDFTIINVQDYPIEVVCNYQRIEGISIDLYLEWKIAYLSVGESLTNRYWLNVTGRFTVTFILEIYIQQRPSKIEGSQLTTGGIVVNKVSFYSESGGSLLDLRIVDQSDTPREATVLLRYSMNDTMPYTPIKQFNGSRFYGVLPRGDYEVYATDIETRIFGRASFSLTENNQLEKVIITLIGFKRFKLELVGVLGLNTTIDNHVGELENVAIYASLYDVADRSTPITRSVILNYTSFPSTINKEVTIWFNKIDFDIEKQYIVQGFITVSGVLAARRWSEKFNINQPKEDPLPFITFERVLLIILISGIVIYVGVKEYQKRKQKNEVLEEKIQN